MARMAARHASPASAAFCRVGWSPPGSVVDAAAAARACATALAPSCAPTTPHVKRASCSAST
eukprot:2643194-Pleurochrysis_carterae.AAC.1